MENEQITHYSTTPRPIHAKNSYAKIFKILEKSIHKCVDKMHIFRA